MSNVSAVIGLYKETEGTPGAAYYITQGINGLALAAQVTGLVLWPVIYIYDESRIWVLPTAVMLISCGWWENFFTATKKSGKRDKITIQLHCSLPPATFPSSTSSTYQRA
jgi:chitin synthase